MKRLLFFKYISFLFLFYFFSTARAQNLSAWEGHYAGTLKVKQMNGTDIVEHHMELDIKKHDDYSYDWVITYGDSAEDIRPYQMIYVDGDQYKLDEKNGIMIKVTKFDSEFIMLFEVGGSYLFVSYSLLDNAIGVKITSSMTREESGGMMDSDGNTIPNVGTFTTVVNESAYLKKES